MDSLQKKIENVLILHQASDITIDEVLKILGVQQQKLQELLREFPRLNRNMFWKQYQEDVEEWRLKLVLLLGEMKKEEK